MVWPQIHSHCLDLKNTKVYGFRNSKTTFFCKKFLIPGETETRYVNNRVCRIKTGNYFSGNFFFVDQCYRSHVLNQHVLMVGSQRWLFLKLHGVCESIERPSVPWTYANFGIFYLWVLLDVPWRIKKTRLHNILMKHSLTQLTKTTQTHFTRNLRSIILRKMSRKHVFSPSECVYNEMVKRRKPLSGAGCLGSWNSPQLPRGYY